MTMNIFKRNVMFETPEGQFPLFIDVVKLVNNQSIGAQSFFWAKATEKIYEEFQKMNWIHFVNRLRNLFKKYGNSYLNDTSFVKLHPDLVLCLYCWKKEDMINITKLSNCVIEQQHDLEKNVINDNLSKIFQEFFITEHILNILDAKEIQIRCRIWKSDINHLDEQYDSDNLLPYYMSLPYENNYYSPFISDAKQFYEREIIEINDVINHSLLKILNDPNLLGGFCMVVDKLIQWNAFNGNKGNLQSKTAIKSFEEMFVLINNSTEFIQEDHSLDVWEKERRIGEQLSLNLFQLPKTQFTDEDYQIYENLIQIGKRLQLDLSELWVNGNEQKLISDFKNYILFGRILSEEVVRAFQCKTNHFLVMNDVNLKNDCEWITFDENNNGKVQNSNVLLFMLIRKWLWSSELMKERGQSIPKYEKDEVIRMKRYAPAKQFINMTLNNKYDEILLISYAIDTQQIWNIQSPYEMNNSDISITLFTFQQSPTTPIFLWNQKQKRIRFQRIHLNDERRKENGFDSVSILYNADSDLCLATQNMLNLVKRNSIGNLLFRVYIDSSTSFLTFDVGKSTRKYSQLEYVPYCSILDEKKKQNQHDFYEDVHKTFIVFTIIICIIFILSRLINYRYIIFSIKAILKKFEQRYQLQHRPQTNEQTMNSRHLPQNLHLPSTVSLGRTHDLSYHRLQNINNTNINRSVEMSQRIRRQLDEGHIIPIHQNETSFLVGYSVNQSISQFSTNPSIVNDVLPSIPSRTNEDININSMHIPFGLMCSRAYATDDLEADFFITKRHLKKLKKTNKRSSSVETRQPTEEPPRQKIGGRFYG
ncbi:hypothetical protein SNEBB_004732 [Seison nebaliae]|nr:hypothetical protein SNEBB_004732 [Seison nebaliae]